MKSITLFIFLLATSSCLFGEAPSTPYCVQHNGNYSDCRDEWICIYGANPETLGLDTTCKDQGAYSTDYEAFCCELDFGKP
jgi:hypothetical protein